MNASTVDEKHKLSQCIIMSSLNASGLQVAEAMLDWLRKACEQCLSRVSSLRTLRLVRGVQHYPSYPRVHSFRGALETMVPSILKATHWLYLQQVTQTITKPQSRCRDCMLVVLEHALNFNFTILT